MGLALDSIRNRKPARKLCDVPPEVKQALSAGLVATMNLTEWLASDRQKLFHSVCKHLKFGSSVDPTEVWTANITEQSALKQSFAVGQWLSQHMRVGDESWRYLSIHTCDIVREWAAIVVGCTPGLTFARRLAWMKLFADDAHSGLREIAWLALRSEVISDPLLAIKSLVPWTGSRNERLRRFASEITRPRGVWCAHIPLLKQEPQIGLPILEPLLMDDSKYVRNSVGNWLNDASKTQPQWVRALAIHWLEQSPSIQTQAIFKRALRTIDS